MTLGAKYTTYPAANFTAAAKRLHNNYSETPWEETDYGQQSWAAGTLRGIIEDLGPALGASEAEERIDSLRMSNLSYGEAMAKVWKAAFGNRQPDRSNHAEMADLIVARLEDSAPQVEVTDSMVNSVALAMFGPSVVYDQPKLKAALAEALQTR